MSSNATDRIMLFNRRDEPLGDLSPSDVLNCLWAFEINGEHSLTIYTMRVLPDDLRVLTQDGTGKWYEWVLDTPDKEHRTGRTAIGRYRFVWSLQADLKGVQCAERRPGIPVPVTARNALTSVLADTDRWHAGTVDLTTYGGLSTYNKNAWECLSDLVSVFGGEVDAEIDVDLAGTGVISRRVALKKHIGETKVTRRFDWGHDVTGIDRNSPPGPRYCRVKPLGKGEAVYGEDGDVNTYTRRITIEDVNDGKDYISDPEAEELFKLPDGNGGYEYPTKIVIYEDIEDKSELKAAAIEDLHNHTSPAVSYEATVKQYEQAGMDVRGVALGDNIHIVDRGFDDDVPLRLEGRVIRVQMQGLSPVINRRTSLTIGRLQETLTDVITRLDKNVSSASSRVTRLEATSSTTAEYLDNLVDHLNEQINATGGYTYLTKNEGLIVYDIAVDDPLVGYNSKTDTWASQVVQIKGGNIRIANEKKPSFEGINDWKWKTLLVSGHIAAELVTAAQITVGYIGSSGDTYIDLDNHTAQLGLSTGPHVVVNSSGMQIYNSTTSLGFFGYESGVGIVRVGQANNAHVKISSNGSIEMKAEGGESFAYFGRGEVNDYSTTGHKLSVYYTLGVRATQAAAQAVRNIISSRYSYMVGDCSFSAGDNNIAAGDSSVALGYQSYAVGHRSFAACGGYAIDDWSIAIGGEAYGKNSICIGHSSSIASDASGLAMYGGKLRSGALRSVAIGYNSAVDYSDTTVIGNGVTGLASNVRFAAGAGYRSAGGSYYNRTALTVDDSGNMQIRGEYRTSSDRRLKKHHAYLGDDAADFVRKLKPALFTKDGKRHVGFYAQDVQAAEPEEWDTETVSEVNYEYRDGIDYSPLTLDYSALIAPLVAYTQQLERKVDQQQKQIDKLIERIEALEAR